MWDDQGLEANVNVPKPELRLKLPFSHTQQKPNPPFPRGLIGQKCTATVKVSGVNCNGLLDTGSQVTTISASFYENHLSEYPIQPLDGLDVEGAKRSILGLKFPKNFVANEPEVSTLTLVNPDIRSSCDVPVLIGTNALDVLYDEHCHGQDPNNLSSVQSTATDRLSEHSSSGEMQAPQGGLA